MKKYEQIVNESVSNNENPLFFPMENGKLCRLNKNERKNSGSWASVYSTTTKNGMYAREKQLWKKEAGMKRTDKTPSPKSWRGGQSASQLAFCPQMDLCVF